MNAQALSELGDAAAHAVLTLTMSKAGLNDEVTCGQKGDFFATEGTFHRPQIQDPK